MKTLIVSLLLLILSPIPSSAQQNSLATLEEGNLRVSLSKTAGKYQLQVGNLFGAEQSPESANVFWLKNPSRLVVDVPGFVGRTSRTVKVSSPELSSIRTGVHSDKLRVVIDIKDSLVPDYESRVDEYNKQVLVDLSFSGQIDNSSPIASATSAIPAKHAPVKQVPASEVEFLPRKPNPAKSTAVKQVKAPAPYLRNQPAKRVPAKILKSTPASEQIKASLRSPASSTEQTKLVVKPPKPVAPVIEAHGENPVVIKNIESSTVIQKEAPPIVATRQILPPSGQPAKLSNSNSSSAALAPLKGIDFKELSGEQTTAVILDVNQEVEYDMRQTQQDVYELLLKRTKIEGMNLALPQFTPDNFFEGFEVVVARQKDNDVVVRIYTNSDTKPSPYRQKGKLWVKPVKK